MTNSSVAKKQSTNKAGNRVSHIIDSDQPETVYSWLDEFDKNMKNKSKGAPFDYSLMKYNQSIKLVNS